MPVDLLAPQKKKEPVDLLASQQPDAPSTKSVGDLVAEDIGAKKKPTTWQQIESSLPGHLVQGAVIDPAMGLEQTLAHYGPEALNAYIAEKIYGKDNSQTAAHNLYTSAIDQSVNNREKNYQESRRVTGEGDSFDASRLTGNVIPYLFGGEILGSTKAASLLSKAPSILQKMGIGALTGLGTTATQTVDTTDEGYDSSKMKQAALGTLLGGVAPVAAKVVSSAIAPKFSEAVQKLLDAKVRLTPGQILGGSFKNAEDKAASIPVVGSFIAASQKRALGDFNKTVLNEALSPIGKTLPSNMEPGRKAVEHVATSISDVYNTTLPKMTGLMDQPFIQDLDGVITSAKGEGVAQNTLDRFKDVIKAQLFDKVGPNGIYTGDKLKEVQSELGRLSSKYLSSESQDDRALGELLGDSQSAFHTMLERHNPQQMDILKSANAAWARFARIRRAASMVGAKDGVFTPGQFSNAVKALDKSVGKGNYAKGNALMQDLSDAGQNVLPSSVPDSGTAGRLLMTALLGGGQFIEPGTATTGAVLSSLYTKPGNALLRKLLTSRPKVLKKAGSYLDSLPAPSFSIPLTSILAPLNTNQQN